MFLYRAGPVTVEVHKGKQENYNVRADMYLTLETQVMTIMSFPKMFIYVNKLVGIFICNPSVFISAAVV